MPSDDFWNPATQFRNVRTAEVLNQSLGALSNIDNALSENDRQNQRQRRPMFYVDPEDQMSDAEIDDIFEWEDYIAPQYETEGREILYGETRPEPDSAARYVGNTEYSAAARSYPIGHPEYWHYVDAQNERNRMRVQGNRNDFLRQIPVGYTGDGVEFYEGPDSPSPRTGGRRHGARVPLGPDNHPMWGHSPDALEGFHRQ